MLKWLTLITLLAICNAFPLPADNVEAENLSFDVNGTTHHETRKVEGRIVTLTDVMDGFIVVLDYKRNILMVKNETSGVCFFSRLEQMHVGKNSKIPFMVETIPNEFADVDTGGEKTEVVIFSPAGQIPTSYMLLTNDAAVTKECASSPSYWMEVTATKMPSKRFFFSSIFALTQITIGIIGLYQ